MQTIDTRVSTSQGSTQQTVERLRGQIRQVETVRRNDDGSIVSSGSMAMDELLPAGGYNRGTIVEWIAERGTGADFLSLLAARNAAKEGGGLVVVDSHGEFYPPAARAMGLKLSQLIILRSSERGPDQHLSPHSSKPLDADDLCWAIDQSLRCQAVAAVWGALPDFESAHAERTWLRRFQLSAETSGCIGCFIRIPSSQAQRDSRGRRSHSYGSFKNRASQSSWAEIQWELEPQPSTAGSRIVKATLARCQGGLAGRSIELDINTSTGNVQEHVPSRSKPAHSMPLAAQLANPKTRRRSARA